jgi:hypothetical protein
MKTIGPRTTTSHSRRRWGSSWPNCGSRWKGGRTLDTAIEAILKELGYGG